MKAVRLKTQQNQLIKQKGSITLLGALGIMAAISGMYATLELGDKMMKKAQYDAHAKALAPVIMRAEMALTQAMVENGLVNQPRLLAEDMLKNGLGLIPGSDVDLNITFGNIQHLDQPETVDRGNGQSIQVHNKFVPLASHADNPKNIAQGETLQKFNAVAVELKSKPSGIFRNFAPSGKAIYGLSDQEENSPEMGSCFCDARFEACMQASKTNDVMGEVDSGDRSRYCETGMAPAVGSFFSFFFGGKPKYPDADEVKLSPQWVGKAYDGSMGGNPTDQNSAAWQAVNQAKLLNIDNGQAPFPEAGWNASKGEWLPGNHNLTFSGVENIKTIFGVFPKYRSNGKVDGEFYVGRSGTCAYPDKGFLPFRMMSKVKEFMLGNKDCLRYTTTVPAKYDFGRSIVEFMTNIGNSLTGANQHYYSCRDFSGIPQSRNGLLQTMRQIWTNPILDWTKSYQRSDCTVKTMHHYGFWIFGGWR